MSKQKKFEVAIIGAGFAGMYLLHRLRGLGITTRVFDVASDVGGTWYWNRYPGARCDIESLQYSYQFDDALQQEWDWSERYAPQPEILKYAEHVADRFDLRRDIQFDTRIESALFDEQASKWQLTTQSGDQITARYCVMATGCLSSPNWPAIEGVKGFGGPTYHTGNWPDDTIDFSGLRVAVIGTGSSAIQSIPLIAAQAKELFVFQRTANYSIPAQNFTPDPERVKEVKSNYAAMRARAKLNHPGIDGVYNTHSAMEVSEQERNAEYERRWQQGGLSFMGAFGDLMLNPDANESMANFVRNKIRTIVHDPKVAETLCPTNIIGGKRLCVDTNYYATFNNDHVHLISVKDEPIEKITSTAVHAHGKAIEIDALVIATGFDAMTGALMNIDIRGRNNIQLRECWTEGPSSYLGLAMANFPNLFTVTGPGSPSVFTNMLPTIEQHVNWIADCLQHMQSTNHTVIEAESAAQDVWWAHHQEIASNGLKGTTDSWYLGANVAGKARVFMPYYGGFPQYCRKCEEVVENGYEGFVLS